MLKMVVGDAENIVTVPPASVTVEAARVLSTVCVTMDADAVLTIVRIEMLGLPFVAPDAASPGVAPFPLSAVKTEAINVACEPAIGVGEPPTAVSMPPSAAGVDTVDAAWEVATDTDPFPCSTGSTMRRAESAGCGQSCWPVTVLKKMHCP